MDKTAINLVLRLILVLAVIPLGSAQGQQNNSHTPEQRFFDWTKMAHDADAYKERRDRMATRLAGRGIDYFLVPSSQGRSHGPTFRQTDDFIYFTGLELPYSILVIDVHHQTSTVYSPRTDVRFESASRTNDFPGRPLADDPSIAQIAGVEQIIPYGGFEPDLTQWVSDNRTLAVNVGRRGLVSPVVKDFIMDWNPAMNLIDQILARHPESRLENAFDDLARLRMIKRPEEIELIRKTITLTVGAIEHAAGFIKDGVTERDLEAELEAFYKRGGAQRLSFASIIKSGPNSLWPWRILAAHHDRRNRAMQDGEIVIFDVGTELDYYVSDVGRTFPVSGKFSPAQIEKLLMTKSVSDAIIEQVRPGITFPELLEIAISAIPENERKYMQTGSFFGHHIGMAAGDPSLLEVPLEAGMIFTIEPWYYNHDDEISVFIEDVVLVTEDGVEVLTARLPRHPEELEQLVGAR